MIKNIIQYKNATGDPWLIPKVPAGYLFEISVSNFDEKWKNILQITNKEEYT